MTAKINRPLTFIFLLASLTVATTVVAQPFPTKPVRLVVPFAPGGGVELTARVLSQKLSEAWKYPVLVDNRTGAGTTIGTEIAAKSPADGYTLLLTNNAL